MCPDQSLMVYITVLVFVTAAGVCSAQAQAGAAVEDSYVFDVLDIREMTMGQFGEMLTRSTALNVTVSEQARPRRISLYLRDMPAKQALRAAARSHGLVVHRSPDGPYEIVTPEEFRSRRDHYKDEAVATLQLKHADAVDIGESLRNLFADRVVWIEPSRLMGDDRESMHQALRRMDRLAGRGQFFYGSADDGAVRDRIRDTGLDGTGQRQDTARFDTDLLQESRSMMLEHASGAWEGTQSGFQLVFVSAYTPNNVMMLRSTDAQALDKIKAAVGELDRPSPQVLLEVRVMELDVGDGRSTGIDWLFERGDLYGGQSTWQDGSFQAMPEERTDGGLEAVLRETVSGATGHNPRTAVLGHLSDRLKARIRLMQSEGKLTQLATPTLLVADKEASQVFIGSQSKFLDSVERTPLIRRDDGSVEGGDLTPNISDQDIGMTLLITPRIHADRSVTLRVLQEETGFGRQRTIDYGEGSFTVQDIQQRSVVTTIVAQDSNWVVIGGLIREAEEEKSSGVPVLRRIPLLGALFRSSGESVSRSELLILIRPSVLIAPGDAAPASDDFLGRTSEHGRIETEAEALNVPQPEVTQTVRDLGWEGHVTIRVDVDAEGRPVDGEILESSGYTSLDNAALEAAKQAEFAPATRHGIPVPSTTQLEYEFKGEK